MDMNFNQFSGAPGHASRLPPFIQYYVMLREALKGLSNGLVPSTLVLFRRLLYFLSNFLRYLWFRKPPWSIPRRFPLADGRPSTQSGILPGVAAGSNNPFISIPPINVNVPGANIAVGGSSAPVTGPSFPLPATGNYPAPQSQLPLANHRRLIPFVATAVLRYEMDTRIEASPGITSIQPLIRQYPPRQLPASTGWEAHVHPEGALYFYHSQKRVFTDTDVQVESFLTDLNACTDALQDLAKSNGVNITSDIELIIQLGVDLDAGDRVCSYYFADHAERTLFWLHELGTGDLFDGVRGVKEPSHIRYAIQFQYWVHCDLYPNNRESESQTGLLKELREIVVYASADVITSGKSLSPFAGEELSKILDLINHLQEITTDGSRHYSMCVIARFMQYFARAKFFNFCGQPCARLVADQSIYSTNDEHAVISAISAVVELICFGAPRAHMVELQRVWVDKSTSSPRWKDFNNKLSKEWISITIYSTVMLTVDLSFLSVPSVNAETSQSAAIIMVYLSTFCVVGSLVVSIILDGQNRKYGSVSANSAVVYLINMTNSMFGDKALAILHSLPYVLLMWGMIYFLGAFCFLVFRSTSAVLLGIAGCGLVFIVFLALWPVWWYKGDYVFSWLRERLGLFE